MIREIELVDFMSHRHTVIEPAAGLTVLVGPNNCGKSAVVAALQILAANTSKKHMMRHGCKECSVTVETEEGHTITWRLKGKVVNYTIDGRDVHRLEGNVPAGLYEVLKLAPVESVDGNETFDVHFATQKTPIFLLNGTGKQAATFFASSSDASRLVAMQQRHKEKTRELGQTEKMLSKQVDGLKVQLEALAAVPDLQLAIEETAGEYERLLENGAKIGLLELRRKALAAHYDAEEMAKARCGVLSPLAAPPALAETGILEHLIGAIEVTEVQQAKAGDCRAILAHVASPPELRPTVRLQQVCEDLSRLVWIERKESARVAGLKLLGAPPLLGETWEMERFCRGIDREERSCALGGKLTGVLKNLACVPECVDTAPLEKIIEGLGGRMRDVRKYTGAAEAFAEVDAPPGLEADGSLERLIEAQEAAEELVNLREEEMRETSRAFEGAHGGILKWAAANPTCPTCGSAIDASAIVARGGGHTHGG